MLKQLYSLITLFLLSISLFAQDASREMVDPSELGGPILATYPINWQYIPEAVLYDNGPYFNSPGGGPNGADGSILQTSLGLNILGFGASQASGFRVADDFVIPAQGRFGQFRMQFFMLIRQVQLLHQQSLLSM